MYAPIQVFVDATTVRWEEMGPAGPGAATSMRWDEIVVVSEVEAQAKRPDPAGLLVLRLGAIDPEFLPLADEGVALFLEAARQRGLVRPAMDLWRERLRHVWLATRAPDERCS